MVKQIIEAFPKEERKVKSDGSSVLFISEMFMDTIQGENFVGQPATFLRCQHCTLNCIWCDTKEVWRKGNPYTVKETYDLMKKSGCIDKLKEGQHLVLTGGSPLKQQVALVELIEMIIDKEDFKPFIEVENECVILPSSKMFEYVDIWNNSPKLENSMNNFSVCHKPEIISKMSSLKNSWFKFVVEKEEDWKEIDKVFLQPKLIKRHQIVLMPEGMTRDELQKHYEAVVNLAVKENVRMTDRLHITIWNKKTGV